MEKLISPRICFKISCLLTLIFSVLLAGCAVTGGSLSSAAYKGDMAEVKSLLDKGHNVDEKGGCGWGWDSDVTALTCAAHGGHMEVTKVLLERGADVNAGSSSWRPLMSAAYVAHTDIAKLLIEKSADVDYSMAKLQAWPLGKDGVKFLERLVKKQPLRQPEILAAKSSTESYPPPTKSDIDEIPAIKTKTNKNAYAIVIGIEQYRQKLPKADFAVSDAKLVSEYFSKVMGYPEENVITLLNDRASNVDMVKYFEKWLSNNADQGSTVFIYYSGHGAPNAKTGDAYLLPYDGDPAFIEQTGYSLKRLYENLSKLPAKNIIVALDSCFSGAGGKSVSAKGSRALVRVEKTSARNIAVLTASQDNQISSSYEDKGHGVFTYFFLKGIKEMLGEDKNSKLELGELYNYIRPQVERTSRRLYNNEQTPQLMTADEQMKKISLR